MNYETLGEAAALIEMLLDYIDEHAEPRSDAPTIARANRTLAAIRKAQAALRAKPAAKVK